VRGDRAPLPQGWLLHGNERRVYVSQKALIQSWLAPWKWLNTCWQAWRDEPPPPELAELMEAVAAGFGIDLYLRE
jgi:hypothetical protein